MSERWTVGTLLKYRVNGQSVRICQNLLNSGERVAEYLARCGYGTSDSKIL